MPVDLPLMRNNITRQDLDALIEFLKGEPILTQSKNVAAFEKAWSEWLGVKHSVFVNSGASANLITIAALRHHRGPGEVIVPPLSWSSDISSVLHAGMTPVFADIALNNLCMDTDQILAKITERTKAVFITYAQGFNGLTDRLLAELEARGIPLIEDVCESHGATFRGRRLGAYGWASNFSYYYAHHMSTIEGGMVCTNDDKLYQTLRMLRSHGMVREVTDADTRDGWIGANPELNPEFIFSYPAWNVRNTEIGGVLGLNQLPRLDKQNERRSHNLRLFLENLDSKRYFTEFDLEGSSNYAFNLILRQPDEAFVQRLMARMRAEKIEYRRGSAGGGNQMRQPYLRGVVPDGDWKNYPNVEHVHFYGFYIGNFPDLEEERIRALCAVLNSVE